VKIYAHGGRVLAFMLVLGIQTSFGASEEASPGEEPAVPPDAISAMEIGAVEARTGALLLSGQAGGDVEGALIWTLERTGADNPTDLRFVIEVDGAGLLAGDRGGASPIGLYAYVVDTGGRIVDHIAQGVVVDAGVYGQYIAATGLKFSGRFEVAPGEYALRVMVRNHNNENFYMSWGLVTVPGAGDPDMMLLPPLFPEENGDWLLVMQAGENPAIELGERPVPPPAAKPALVEDRAGELWLGGSGWGEDERVGLRIVNSLGRTVSEPVVELVGPAIGDFGFRRAAFSPVDAPPGNYTLVVTVSDDRTETVVRRALPIVVVGRDDRPVWPARSREGADAVLPAVETQKRSAPKIKKGEARDLYRQALVLLGGGDTVGSRRAVADLERSAFAGSGVKAGRVLGEAEYAESKALARIDPECLIPMAFLHRELYRGYAARNEGELAAHARRMAITYAEQLARLDPGNGFSERLMVNMAADLAQTGASSGAHELLERTVRLNPDYRAALLSLGFSYEQNGGYFEAAMTYRRLVQVHPGDDEGRLRLAVNLIRIGDGGDGLEILRGLLGDDVLPWVQTIAAQELVRFLLEHGESDEAEETVRTALLRRPQDQRLWILLAGNLERSNRYSEAIESVSHLPPAARGVSPRARYSEWPSLGVGASQGALAARSGEALPTLRAALGGPRGEK
jgi:Flp pilus assembly protein TadD